jgi:hypothetical protein
MQHPASQAVSLNIHLNAVTKPPFRSCKRAFPGGFCVQILRLLLISSMLATCLVLDFIGLATPGYL